MANRWVRLIRALLGLAIIGYAARFLVQNWEAIRSADLEWQLRPTLIAASIALTVATYALLVEGWRRMVAGWGVSIGWWPAARVWVLSSMGKYLPGKVWAIAGMAVLGKEAGIPATVATGSAVLLQVVSIGTGALVVALTGARELEAARPGVWVGLFAIVGVALICLGLVLWPAGVNAVLRRVVPGTNLTPPAPTAVLTGVAINAIAWLLYGVALHLLAAGVFPGPGLGLVQATGAFATSYLAGFLFLLAPGGFGVREVVFVLVTKSVLGPTQALALAAVSRLTMTCADLLAAAPFVLTLRRHRGD